MILLDANLLIYAAMSAMPEHRRTREWLADVLSSTDNTVALTWASLYAFVRIITNRRIMGDDAVALRPAWDAAEAFRRQASVVMVGPGRGHPNVAAELIATPGLTSTDVPDVQLAAVAVERGLTVATHDHGFGRFTNLRWFDPLA